MMVSNIAQAIGHEVRQLPRVWRGLRKRRFPLAQATHFVVQRVLAAEREPRETRPFRTPEGVLLYNRRDFVMYQEMFLLDEYHAATWQAALAQQHEPVVLDIGANLGFFAALCLTICPSARLRCFELIPECADVIRRRVEEMGGRQFAIETGAVGAQDGGMLAIHYDLPFASTNRVDQATGALTATVPLLSLDGWRRRNPALCPGAPFLVKIDVEGAEADVLPGGRETLGSAEYIVIELHNTRDLLDQLMSTHEILRLDPFSETEWIAILKRKPA